jgi:UDP-GlcNAc:undecaprenyl-phosphate GlcNAc-1-phosphate transferase
LDDIFNIHPYWRLAVGIIAGLIVVGSGIGIAFVTNPLGPGVIELNQPQIAFKLFGELHTIWIIADIFALIFILWNMNIVNWSKGVDGQLPAFITIAFIFIGLLSDSFSADPTEFNNALMSFLLAGSFAGLLIYNWYPQKIMPGYGAGSLAGFFLSVLAIISGAKLATTLMVLAIPTADAIYTIVRRLLTGKSPIWGDRGHLHHQLLDNLGWGRRRISIFYAGASLVMGALALSLNTTGKLITLVISFSLVFAFHIYTTISTKPQISKKA